MSELDFDERSFQNLVNCFRDELIQIDAGADARELFGSRHGRVSLVKKGVLVCKATQKGRIVSLSPRTRMVLNI